MKRNCLMLFAILAFAGPVPGGTYFYTVYFDSPINQVGQPPVVGRPWGQVPCDIVFGEPLVESSFGHLQHQPLLFTAMRYQQIEFCLGERAPDYFVDFDFESRSLNGSKFAFSLVFDTPSVQVFYLHGLGYIGVPPANSQYLPGWTDGEPHHVHIDVNLTNATWALQLDHGAAFTGPFHSDTGDVQSLRMDLSTWYGGTPDNTNVQIAIDNVLIGTGIFPPPPTISCPGTLDLECSNAAVSTLQAHVLDTSGSPLSVVWTVDGTAVQTNLIAPDGNFTETNLSLIPGMGTGTHLVVISASNGQSVPANCATAVTVVDTTPPVISRVSANPSRLWPPDRQMVPVTLTVDAVDYCGLVGCKIIGVRDDESRAHTLRGRRDVDWLVTGDLALLLRAARSEGSAERTYVIDVQCEDAAGNRSQRSVTVTVPHSEAVGHQAGEAEASDQ